MENENKNAVQPLTEENLADVSGGVDLGLRHRCHFTWTGNERKVGTEKDLKEWWVECGSSACATCFCHKKFQCVNRWHMAHVEWDKRGVLVPQSASNHDKKIRNFNYNTKP